MNKIVLFFLFSLLACSISTQNRGEANSEKNQKLLAIAKDYVVSNSDDKHAADLLLKVTQIKNTISNHMNTISNGSYTNMDTKQKVEYVRKISKNDEKLRALNMRLRKAYRVNHRYFSDVDANYKSTLSNFSEGHNKASNKRMIN